MHIIDGVAVGSINHAELEAQGEQEPEPEPAKAAPTKAAKGAATVTSGDVT
jgi:hypothetical protein